MTKRFRLRSSISRGGMRHRRRKGLGASGPTITAPGSIDISTFKIGTTQTITAGTATASGGGAVTYEFQHLSDGQVRSSSTTADPGYAHVAVDDTETGVAQWRAVETGGTNPGSTPWQTVASGQITYPAPTAAGGLLDQSFFENSGILLYDASGDFTGSDLQFSLVSPPSGVTINTGTGVISFDTDTMPLQTGTPIVVRATNSGGFADSGFSLNITAPATAPDAFVDADWSVATGAGATDLDIIIASLPNNNGAGITNVQYDVDGSGTWIDLPAYAGPGTYTADMAAVSTLYAIRLRAENGEGFSAPSNSESATSGAGAATAPAAFIDANWSVGVGANVRELNINVATLPNNGGSVITDIEYEVDASGSWISLGTAAPGTVTVAMAAADTAYAIRLRAVNAVGNGPAGNTENGTSAALVISGYSYNGTDTITLTANGTGTLFSSTTAATETGAANIENGVGAINTDADVLSSGANNITVSYPDTFDDNWLNIVLKNGSDYSNVISTQYTFPDIVPRAFEDLDWSVATGSGANELDITIAQLPSNGGQAITDVEVEVDGSGTWISLGAVSGTITLTMAAASTSYNLRLRGVNSVGDGLPGNTESATSGAAGASAPSAFVDANWSVATGSGPNQLDITIASLPANGGAAITDVEYDVDASGTWISLGATSGTVTVSMAAASTSYTIRLRAVNSVGSGPAGNSESATSGAAAAGIAFVNSDLTNAPNPAGSPVTLTYTPAAAGNVLILIVYLDSNVNASDPSLDSGGGNHPTWNGNTMAFGAYAQISRRQCAIYGIQAGTTSPADFSLAPANTMRGATIEVFEYSGVDTTNIFNALGVDLSGGAAINPTLTTVDASGVLIGGACWNDEGTAATVTTGTQRGTEGQSGGGARDIRHIAADIAVSSAGATEGVAFNQAGNVSACSAVIELNPA